MARVAQLVVGEYMLCMQLNSNAILCSISFVFLALHRLCIGLECLEPLYIAKSVYILGRDPP